jgi:hypothetical protein
LATNKVNYKLRQGTLTEGEGSVVACFVKEYIMFATSKGANLK